MKIIKLTTQFTIETTQRQSIIDHIKMRKHFVLAFYVLFCISEKLIVHTSSNTNRSVLNNQ